jgi:O-acetyl-ADP-ribose deacetylase (regulator of RNase III)
MIEIVQADITTLHVDAIANAASSALRGGGGVDGAIHRAAGPRLLEECMRHPGCPTGTAVLTGGYDLPARFVIHTVGPIWRGGGANEDEMLARAYESAFRLALATPGIRSIAFPAISTGVYGFPKERAARIAASAMLARDHQFDRIIACLFDAGSVVLYERALDDLRRTTEAPRRRE